MDAQGRFRPPAAGSEPASNRINVLAPWKGCRATSRHPSSSRASRSAAVSAQRYRIVLPFSAAGTAQGFAGRVSRRIMESLFRTFAPEKESRGLAVSPTVAGAQGHLHHRPLRAPAFKTIPPSMGSPVPDMPGLDHTEIARPGSTSGFISRSSETRVPSSLQEASSRAFLWDGDLG